MIQTTLTSTARYAAMSPLLAKAVNFIAMAKDLPVGRYEIQGADIYAMVVETTLKEPKECRLEVHQRYIDVQSVLCGVERFGFSPIEECKMVDGEFDTTSDIGFFSDSPRQYMEAHAGDVLLFFPEDAHAPLVGSGVIRKVIVKVLVTAM